MIVAAFGVVRAVDRRARAVVLAHRLDRRRVVELCPVGVERRRREARIVAASGPGARPRSRRRRGCRGSSARAAAPAGRGTPSASSRARTSHRRATRSRRSARCRAPRAGHPLGVVERHPIGRRGRRDRGRRPRTSRGRARPSPPPRRPPAPAWSGRSDPPTPAGERRAVAGQVDRDDREPLGQPRRDRVPHQVGLREPVHEQQRRAVAADHGVHGAAGRFEGA